VAHSSLGFASIAGGRRRPIFETSPRSRTR
jgi:hypothetical protein